MTEKNFEPELSEMFGEDEEKIVFYKNHGFIGEWSNVIESTNDLLRVLKYCSSDKMNFTPEAKRRIRELHDWIECAAGKEGMLTEASNIP